MLTALGRQWAARTPSWHVRFPTPTKKRVAGGGQSVLLGRLTGAHYVQYGQLGHDSLRWGLQSYTVAVEWGGGGGGDIIFYSARRVRLAQHGDVAEMDVLDVAAAAWCPPSPIPPPGGRA